MKKLSTPPPARKFSWSRDMKRDIAIGVLLLFVLIVLVLGCIMFFDLTIRNFYFAMYHPEFLKSATFYIPHCIFVLLATIADITAIVLLTLKEFPLFKPLVDKFKARKEKNKQEKAEAERQARIEQLQAELDELKKDE